jgi:hypothetical protein
LGSGFGIGKTITKENKDDFFIIKAKKNEYIRTSTIEGTKKNKFIRT